MIKIEFSADNLSGVLSQMKVFLDTQGGDAPKSTHRPTEVTAAIAQITEGLRVPEPAPEVEQVVEDPKSAEPSEITYDHVRDGVLKLAGHYGDRAKVLTFLNKFNVSNANQLDKGRYPEFMAAIEKELG